MTISAAGGLRIDPGTTAQKAILHRDGASHATRDTDPAPAPGGVGRAATIGLLAAGGVGIAGGLALRGFGHGRIGTAIAAIGGALLGASLLTGCSTTTGAPATPRRSHVPGDEGPTGENVSLIP